MFLPPPMLFAGHGLQILPAHVLVFTDGQFAITLRLEHDKALGIGIEGCIWDEDGKRRIIYGAGRV